MVDHVSIYFYALFGFLCATLKAADAGPVSNEQRPEDRRRGVEDVLGSEAGSESEHPGNEKPELGRDRSDASDVRDHIPVDPDVSYDESEEEVDGDGESVETSELNLLILVAKVAYAG